MTCQESHDRLVDIVDAERAGVERDEALEAHLASCEACRALVADLQRIRATAATFERHPLPPELWARVARRIGSEPRTDAGTAAGGARGLAARRSTWVSAAAAAALIVVVGAALWMTRGGYRTAPTPADGATTGAGNSTSAALVESIEHELQLAADHYEKAIAGLEQVAHASDAPLDPAVMSTLRQNLALIDRAIDESRVALKTQPDNPVAQQSLFEAFRRKIALLQDTIALMNEMRKGDEAGAARVLEGLDQS